jgi:hypothetical protein
MDYSPDDLRELVNSIWHRAADKAVNAEAARVQAVALTEIAQRANSSAAMRQTDAKVIQIMRDAGFSAQVRWPVLAYVTVTQYCSIRHSTVIWSPPGFVILRNDLIQIKETGGVRF